MNKFILSFTLILISSFCAMTSHAERVTIETIKRTTITYSLDNPDRYSVINVKLLDVEDEACKKAASLELTRLIKMHKIAGKRVSHTSPCTWGLDQQKDLWIINGTGTATFQEQLL